MRKIDKFIYKNIWYIPTRFDAMHKQEFFECLFEKHSVPVGIS